MRRHTTFEHFSELKAETPQYEELSLAYDALHKKLDEAQSVDDEEAVLHEWDKLNSRFSTWSSLVSLRFYQDTADEERVKARDYANKLRPRVQDLDVKLKQRILESTHREELTSRFGEQLFLLWQSDADSFSPEIEKNLVRESDLEAEYTSLMAKAKVTFQDKEMTLSELRKYTFDADRNVRLAAAKVRWDWFDENRGELDRIYDSLVKERHAMAQTLGFENFIELGYLRMQRVDYNQNDVEKFRAEVREHLVPLCQKLRQRQAEILGVDTLMSWDEGTHDPEGNPAPQGDDDWIMEQSKKAFDEMGPELSEFYRMMFNKGLLDLSNRDNKAGGGFCTSLSEYGVPFIFANFNGSQEDIRVLIHEMGHAFQAWSSKDAPLVDLVWPTFEACEIHSMGLEFLTYKQLDHFFGQEEAERSRRIHLTGALTFIPYGVAVDHFQHLVYANPDATPDERRAMWQKMEELYLPWRKYGDLKHPAEGGFWQGQSHIYGAPFYYIDYTLAQTCALQYWDWSQKDHKAAMESYLALCKRGGCASFQKLVDSAALQSPFSPGCLTGVVGTARKALHI